MIGIVKEGKITEKTHRENESKLPKVRDESLDSQFHIPPPPEKKYNQCPFSYNRFHSLFLTPLTNSILTHKALQH